MDDGEIDGINQPQQLQQQPAADVFVFGAAAAAAVAAARNKATRLKLIHFLERYDDFPRRTRTDMNELAEEYLRKAEDKVYLMLCDNRYGDDYRGLDSSRDTEDEVEAIVRFFPDVLSRETDIDIVALQDGNYARYPIHFLTSMYTIDPDAYRCNLKAISFIYLLARLAIEFGSFQDNERGGLLCDDNDGFNTLQYLTESFSIIYGEEQNQLADNTYLTLLIRLRHTGLFKIEDIQDHRLVHRVSYNRYFAENRFRFLIEWDPVSLLQTDAEGCLPLHLVASSSTIQDFRSVFDLGLRYYPIKKGINLLFQKDDDGDTPFQLAFQYFGRDEVMKVIEETLLLNPQQQQQEQRVADDDDNNNNNFVGPYNIIDAFILAAMDEQVHFDCVYFLLRRQPDLLKKLLSRSVTNNDNFGNGSSGSGSESGSHDGGDNNEIDNGNVRDDDIDTHLDCKKDDKNNGNNKDNGIENHVDRMNNNGDGNNENDEDNEMLIIDANSNANANANKRKRK